MIIKNQTAVKIKRPQIVRALIIWATGGFKTGKWQVKNSGFF